MRNLKTMSFVETATSRGILLGVLASSLLMTACESPTPVPVTIPGVAPSTISRAAVSGVAQDIAHYYFLNPDCTSAGPAVVRITTAPTHGTAAPESDLGYPGYNRDNQRYECNKQKTPMMKLIYTSSPGYQGDDTVKISVIYPNGEFRNETFTISVK